MAGIKAGARLGLPISTSGIVCMRQDVLQISEAVVSIPAALV